MYAFVQTGCTSLIDRDSIVYPIEVIESDASSALRAGTVARPEVSSNAVAPPRALLAGCVTAPRARSLTTRIVGRGWRQRQPHPSTAGRLQLVGNLFDGFPSGSVVSVGRSVVGGRYGVVYC